MSGYFYSEGRLIVFQHAWKVFQKFCPLCYKQVIALSPRGGGGGGGSPYSGLYGEAPPERGAFFKLAVYERVGKVAILVYERVPKSAGKWRKWWLKRITSKVATFWQK